MRARVGYPVLVLIALAALAESVRADPGATLTGVEKTEHFEIRFRPGSRAGAAVDRIAVMAERDLARICTQLGIPVQGQFRLFLYDGLPEMQAITRTMAAGFGAGADVHVPYDNDQTRFHELVHVVAYALPKAGDEARSLFYADGLANALLEFVDGVHVHAVAAFYRRRGQLPPLAEIAGAPDFYAYLRTRPGFKGYDVAASYMRHLIDTQGVEKVRAFYKGQPAKAAFGTTSEALEKHWLAFLDGYSSRPEVETLLRRVHGEPAAFDRFPLDPDERLGAEIVGQPSEWKTLGRAKLEPDDAKTWSRKGKVIHGESKTQDWSYCELGTKKYGDCVVRATVKPSSGCLGVQLRLGEQCQAMLVQAGTFVWTTRPTASSQPDSLLGRTSIDFVIVRKAGEMTIYFDGFEIVRGSVSEDPSPVGIGVALGQATFENIRVRPLK